MTDNKTDDATNILERIANFYVDLTICQWTDYFSGKPENYDTMLFYQKHDYISNILPKLEYLLENPKSTLINWAWDQKSNRSFDEFLSHQFAQILVQENPKESLFEKIANKVKKMDSRKVRIAINNVNQTFRLHNHYRSI